MILSSVYVSSTRLDVLALVVRFITHRFIGEYDPSLEKIYTYNTQLDEEATSLEILDAAGQPHVSDLLLELKIALNNNIISFCCIKKLLSLRTL